MLFAVIHAVQQRLDGAALVSLRFVIRNEFEVHGRSSWLLALGLWLKTLGTVAVSMLVWERAPRPSRPSNARLDFFCFPLLQRPISAIENLLIIPRSNARDVHL